MLKNAYLAASAIFIYLIFTPIQFTAKASFKLGKEKIEQSLPHTLLQTADFVIQDKDYLAALILLSQDVLARAVQKLGLQIEILSPLSSFIKRPYEHLLLEFKFPWKKDSSFIFQDLCYLGDKTLSFYLRPLSSCTYEILNKNQERLCMAKLQEVISFDDLSFSLQQFPTNFSIGKLYSLRIHPLESVVDFFKSHISIKLCKKTPRVLFLSLKHPHQLLGACFLNTLMQTYQDVLKEENQLTTEQQIDYLDKKYKDLSAKFDQEIDEHASYLEKNLGEQGFISLSQQIEMLAAPKEAYLSKLFDVEFDLARFQTPNATFQDIETKNLLPANTALAKLKNTSFNFLLDNVQNPKTLIDLNSAKELYMNYNAQLDLLQKDLKQLSYLKEKLPDDQFNLSSIGTILSDSVTDDLIRKTSEVELQLKDVVTHSPKEHERLKSALKMQKNFLSSHLQQVQELKKIQLHLTQDKMTSLKHIIVDLLKIEKKLLQEKLLDLNTQMSDLPNKWRFENKLKFKNELTRDIMQGLVQVSESKQLTSHLYQVDAKPLEKALPASRPNYPYLFLSTLTSFFIIYTLSYLYYFFKSLAQGMPISLESLKSLNESTSGRLSSKCDAPFLDITQSDCQTLRLIASSLEEHKTCEGLMTALFLSSNANYSHNLAHILHARGRTSVILECDFERIPSYDEIPGLYHFLSGILDTPPIKHFSSFDSISFGCKLMSYTDIFTQKAFSSLLKDLKTRYDFIFLVSPSSLNSSHHLDLLPLINFSVISFERETLDELKIYSNWVRQKQNRYATFVESAVKPFI